MPSFSKYEPLWPETVIFWGAGATASLGIPTTNDLGQNIWKIAISTKELSDRLHGISCLEGFEAAVSDLMVALGDGLESAIHEFNPNEREAAKRLFNGYSEEKCKAVVVNLRHHYDWDALKRIIGICATKDGSGQFLNDLFNIIDLNLAAGQGIFTGETREKERFVDNHRLKPARNCLVMLINLQISCAYMSLIEDRHDVLNPYIAFAETLSTLMQKEGVALANHDFADRKFYLFSYAFISMNFDPILVWLLFNAHRELNGKKTTYVGSPPRPVKLFHDFGYLLGIRKVDSDTPEIKYPYNEAVVQRINGPDGSAVRIGKFYFPHGACNWRECPYCGKLTVIFGDKWGYDSKSLFPPLMFKTCGSIKDRSEEERNARRDDALFDSVQCSHCGTITRMRDTPMIMQSTFKGPHPPYLEEIQRDLKICIENAKHIVLLGYSIPSDDIVWRSTLLTRISKTTPVYCSVVVGSKGSDKWMSGSKLTEYVAKIKKDHDPADWHLYGIHAIEAALQLFKVDKVRAYTRGVPNVWEGPCIEQKVVDLLYPSEFHFSFPSKRESSVGSKT